jgi:hypothetical protein
VRAALFAFAIAPFALAQQQASEPAPRFPDGHVNLGSAPDKKGYWETRPAGGGFRPTGEVPFQPWAKAVHDYRQKTQSIESPSVDCKPAAGPSFFNSPGFEFVDAPELKRVFMLDIAGPHSWRVVYMDGRPHPPAAELRPTYYGHSIGHWENNDTLVIDSVGFNEKQWPLGAYPTTSQLHLTERISRPTMKSLTYEATVDDPGAYTKPWTGKFTIAEKGVNSWIAGGEMFEYICEDAGR